MSPQLESLEGKTLLSAGSAMQHLAPRLAAAPMVGEAVSFRGTLAGSDSDVSLSGIPHVVTFHTSGTLVGPGSTRLHGTLSARANPRPGQLLGQFLLRNTGGSMTLNVHRSATAGTFTDKVVQRGELTPSIKGRLATCRSPWPGPTTTLITSTSRHGSSSFRADVNRSGISD